MRKYWLVLMLAVIGLLPASGFVAGAAGHAQIATHVAGTVDPPVAS